MRPNRADELAGARNGIVTAMSAAHEAREQGLGACRKVIRCCSKSIRMTHRREFGAASDMAGEAEVFLREAQAALEPFPKIAYAGFLHDAEKEYAEARLTAAFVEGAPLPGPDTLRVDGAAWLNGLAEAASELRRYLLDELRSGDLARGDELLEDMDDVYELLVGIDFPDALTGGLRRTTDAFRAVLERTRSDYTITVMQAALRSSIESHLPAGPPASEASGGR